MPIDGASSCVMTHVGHVDDVQAIEMATKVTQPTTADIEVHERRYPVGRTVFDMTHVGRVADEPD